MNGAGKADLVVMEFDSRGPSATTFAVNTSTPGSLSFAPPQNFTGGAGCRGLAVADLNETAHPT